MSEPKQENKHGRLSRTAFVTIGATAGFRSLLQEIVSDKFLTTLKSLDFTHLTVQCGPDLEYFETIKPRDALQQYGLIITAFSYAPDLNDYFMQASRGEDENGKRAYGVIISHAGPFHSNLSLFESVAHSQLPGSGSIIGALEFDSKLVAVPNPELMDNHQLEIAEEMESQGFLAHGTLGYGNHSFPSALFRILTGVCCVG
jgi:beta-1,4-N-acetylglucosaminyltransferase